MNKVETMPINTPIKLIIVNNSACLLENLESILTNFHKYNRNIDTLFYNCEKIIVFERCTKKHTRKSGLKKP